MDDTNKTSEQALKARLWRGLSGKVLLLTIVFVLLGEVLIFLPSIANFRINWLKSRIATSEVAALVVEAAPDNMVSDKLRKELLRGAEVKIIALNRGTARYMMLQDDGELMIAQRYDLRERQWLEPVIEAFKVLFRTENRLIGVTDHPPKMSGSDIEIALEEKPLRDAMLAFSANILTLSIILSIIVAAMVFLALNYVLVRPLRRFTKNMLRFAKDPEDQSRIIETDPRQDEIGIAQRELQNMQKELSSTLQQKNRLAALGLAVSKVSHDLRNMLATAQLISDRLSMVDDPTVQRFAPKLISSLDRAIGFCAQTLKFGRASEAPPSRERFELRSLTEEVIDTAAIQASSHVLLYNDVARDVFIDADREQLFRILMNLTRNSVQALEASIKEGTALRECVIRMKAWREGGVTTIEVRDNGPGVPEKARQHLFEAFKGGARAGGTGLGLAIANELTRAHGGELRLINDADMGATFWVVLPDRVTELHPGRRGQRDIAAGE
ncbi:MAG TPA: HAMP domain-containing histidine kinase [Rhizobiales bacterium]|nr:HAMP domain-containing histidine kinase [Hyphomicrobiales bacterium]